MIANQKKNNQPRSKARISREAEALRKNIAKRKLQQSKRSELKKETNNG